MSRPPFFVAKRRAAVDPRCMGQAIYITGTANRTGVQLRNLYALTDCVITSATTPFAKGSLNGQTVKQGTLIRTLFTQIQLSSGVMMAEQSTRLGDVETGVVPLYISDLMSIFDWRLAGVDHGLGIPDLSSNRVDLTQAPYNIAEGLGQPSQTTALNAALTALGDLRSSGDLRGTTLQGYLPAGNYNLAGGAVIDRCELVGDGESTVLHLGAKLSFDRGLGSTHVYAINGGDLPAGTTQITVQTSAPTVGNFARIAQDDDGTIVNSTGTEGAWDPWSYTPNRSKGQQVQITAVVNNGDGTYGVTFTPPLISTFSGSLNPKLEWYGVINTYCGISDLMVRSANLASPTTEALRVYRCSNWWMKNVRTQMFNTNHVWIRDSMCGHISECDMEESRQLYPNGGYGIRFDLTPSQVLVENTYIVGMRSPVIISGGAGNVITDTYCGIQINYEANIQVQTFSFHACYPEFFLIDNCVIDGAATTDNTHGNSANNIYFRDAVSGRGFDPRTGFNTTRRNIAIRADQKARNIAHVGCVLGWEGMTGVYEVHDTDRSDAINYIHTWGFTSDGDSLGAGNDSEVLPSMDIHANWDWVNQDTVYGEGKETELPVSLYYESGAEPAHFPVCNYKDGTHKVIPAEQRFLDRGGAASLILAGDPGLLILDSWSFTNFAFHDIYFNEANATLYCAVRTSQLQILEIVDGETFDWSTFVTAGWDVWSVAGFDGYLWIGGYNGELAAASMTAGGATIQQSGSLGTRIYKINNNGSFLIIAGRDGLYSVEHTGIGNWAERGEVTSATAGGFIYDAFAIGSEIFYTVNDTGNIRYATINGSGVISDVGNKATTVGAKSGLWFNADHLYCGTATSGFKHFSRGASGALTLENTYSTPAEVQWMRHNNGYLYLATNGDDCQVWKIEADGSCTLQIETVGLSEGEAIFPYGAENKFFHGAGFAGVTHYQWAT